MSTEPKKVHQGELLQELVAWSGLTQEEFATRIKLSRVWLSKAFKEELVTRKNQAKICIEYNVPEDYWKGKIALADIHREVSEDGGEYRTKYQVLKEENEKLKEEVLNLQKKLINAFELVEELRVEIKIARGYR